MSLSDPSRGFSFTDTDWGTKARHGTAQETIAERLGQLVPKRENNFRSQGPGFGADHFQEQVVLSGQFQDSGSARAVYPEQPRAGRFGQTNLLTELLAKGSEVWRNCSGQRRL